MKKLGIIAMILTLMLFLISSVSAATYYVDAVDGDDANDGLSSENAWKTLSKVSSTTFDSGDTILLHRGQSWREQLTLKKPVGEDMSLTVSSYGLGGSKPVINGADTISNSFTPYDGTYKGQTLDLGQNVYVNPLGYEITQLFISGGRKDIAREPNGGYYITTDVSNNHVVSDEKLTEGFDYQGSNVYVRINNWYLEKKEISNYDYSTGKTEFTESISYLYAYGTDWGIKPGWGFFYANHPAFIDQDYEWAQDSDYNLYIRLPSDPSNYGFAGSVHDYGIKAFWNREGKLILNEIQVKNAADIGIYVKTDEFTATHVPVLKSNNIGIYPLSNKISINQCHISQSNTRGISIYQADEVSITNSDILDNGKFSTQDEIGQTLTGISIYGANKVGITGNTIEGTGYAAISISGASKGVEDLTIKNNIISDFCLLLNDCGGIYINGKKINIVTSDISNNIINDGLGNTDGTPYTKGNIANGIYLDVQASGFSITDNTIYDVKTVGGAIKVNGGNNNVIKDNLVYYSHTKGAPFSINGRYTTPMDDNIIGDNIFYSEDSIHSVYLFKVLSDFEEGVGDPRDHFGQFSGNKNFNNLDDNMITYRLADGQVLESDFKTNMLEDFNLNGMVSRFEVNPSSQKKTVQLDSSYCDTDGNSVGDSVSIDPFSSVLLFDCSCRYECPNGCENGACIPGECIDSDGGENYYEKGTVTLGDITVTDFCSDAELTEFACDPDFNEIIDYQHICHNGCHDGACLPIPELTCNNNGVCEIINDEDSEKCPEECYCGDSICDETENGKTCPEDCSQCIPEWECFLEPATCPPEGVQNKVCVDTKCGTGKKRIESIRCVPGVCSECFVNEICYPVSTRVILNNVASYCYVTKKFMNQKELGEQCQNNYECRSNECSDGECISLRKELERTQSILKRILDWLRNIF